MSGPGAGDTLRDPLSDELPYRACVGIVLLNDEGRIWLGRRIAKIHDEGLNSALWQMPQGGIDDGEDPHTAALRELEEETGVKSVRIERETAGWLAYDLPRHLVGRALKGRYRGQKQKWFAMRLLGGDAEINITPDLSEPAEFDAWKWAGPDEVLEGVVAFKRDVYCQVLEEFGDLLKR